MGINTDDAMLLRAATLSGPTCCMSFPSNAPSTPSTSRSIRLETVHPMKDGLPKFKDLPKEAGGSGAELSE